MKTRFRSKMAEFHRVLVSSTLNRGEAWTFYFAIYLPSIGYLLPLCHFTKKELDNLHRKVMSKMIARCGFCRKTKQEIVYGPVLLTPIWQARMWPDSYLYETLEEPLISDLTPIN
jgi:hypothetical protein